MTAHATAFEGGQHLPHRTDSEKIASIETLVIDMKHRLFGNGQPGEVTTIKARISKLENWKWWVVGIAVGLGAAAGNFVPKIVMALAK